jgi:hypothetical protein
VGDQSEQGDELYAVALLRVALELKRNPASGLEACIHSVAERMRLNEGRLRTFLLRHVDALEGVAPARASAPGRRTPRG